MKSPFTILIGVVVVCVLVATMFARQVRYNEKAVRTTFRKADPRIIDQPGLRLRIPWAQDINTYDCRVRILHDKPVQVYTDDNVSVVVEAYVIWRIDNPLRFYERLETEKRAEEQLVVLMRDSYKIVSEYRFNQLVNAEPSELKLDEIEQTMLTQLQGQLSDQADLGIEAMQVGIRRLVLPPQVTEKVFEAMRTNRQALASETRVKGDAEASRLQTEAESIKKTILAFATKRAKEIRAIGQQEAADEFKNFAENQELAIEIRKLEALKKMLSTRPTIILPVEEIWPDVDALSRTPARGPSSP